MHEQLHAARCVYSRNKEWTKNGKTKGGKKIENAATRTSLSYDPRQKNLSDARFISFVLCMYRYIFSELDLVGIIWQFVFQWCMSLRVLQWKETWLFVSYYPRMTEKDGEMKRRKCSATGATDFGNVCVLPLLGKGALVCVRMSRSSKFPNVTFLKSRWTRLKKNIQNILFTDVSKPHRAHGIEIFILELNLLCCCEKIHKILRHLNTGRIG